MLHITHCTTLQVLRALRWACFCQFQPWAVEHAGSLAERTRRETCYSSSTRHIDRYSSQLRLKNRIKALDAGVIGCLVEKAWCGVWYWSWLQSQLNNILWSCMKCLAHGKHRIHKSRNTLQPYAQHPTKLKKAVRSLQLEPRNRSIQRYCRRDRFRLVQARDLENRSYKKPNFTILPMKTGRWRHIN